MMSELVFGLLRALKVHHLMTKMSRKLSKVNFVRLKVSLGQL